MTAKQESSSLDWNDLHVEFGLDVVREQLLAAAANEPPVRTAGLPGSPADEAPDLPPAPSEAAAGEAAPPSEGSGENGWTLDKIRVRFALVEGTTSAFDLYRKAIIKKAAFLAMVGKALGNEWYDLLDKKGIDHDHARQFEADAKLGKRMRQGGFEDYYGCDAGHEDDILNFPVALVGSLFDERYCIQRSKRGCKGHQQQTY